MTEVNDMRVFKIILRNFDVFYIIGNSQQKYGNINSVMRHELISSEN